MASCTFRLRYAIIKLCKKSVDTSSNTALYLVAAGLRATLANSGYNARELAFQFTDSGANLIFTSAGGLAIVRAMFRELGVTASEAGKKIIVIGDSLEWAGGPSALKPELQENLTSWEDLLTQGTLPAEEKFDGALAKQTSYICYSSGLITATYLCLNKLLQFIRRHNRQTKGS